jgi:hypothetical protein
MSGTGPRQTVFVCVSIAPDGELLTKIVPATTVAEATQLFADAYLHAPKEILGPFFKKRAQVIESTVVLKFSNVTKKAVYNDWIVNAFLLKEPENQAFLVFIKRVDDKKIPTPKGTITVPIADLRFV